MREKRTVILEINNDILRDGVFVGPEANTGNRKGNVGDKSARFYLDIEQIDGKQVDIEVVATVFGVNYSLAKFKKAKKPTTEVIDVTQCPVHVRAVVQTNKVDVLVASVVCERF